MKKENEKAPTSEGSGPDILEGDESSSTAAKDIVASASDSSNDAGNSRPMKQIALELAAKGYRVHPLAEGAKGPPVEKDWPAVATDAAAMVELLWDDREYNPAIHCGAFDGDYLLVVDVDMKNGKNGADTLKALEAEHGDLPSTLKVETPSGGWHLFFRAKNPVANSAGKLGAGVDIRGEGGYVVAPGARVSGKEYRIAEDRPVADAPDWLVKLAGEARERRKPGEPKVADGVELDTAQAVERAREALAASEPAIEGSGGDNHTICIANRIGDLGISPEMCLDLMLEDDGWNSRCVPPWSPAELEKKVRSAYNSRQEQVGATTAVADFAGVKAETVAAGSIKGRAAGRVSDLVFYSAITAERIDWMWKNVLAVGKAALFSGNPGVGKGMLTCHIAAVVSTGGVWPDGSRCPQGSVMMIGAEDGAADTIKPRLVAAGADVSKVAQLTMMTTTQADGVETQALPDLNRDLPRIEEMLDAHPDIRVIVVDPITAYCGEKDTYKDAEVRHVLTPLGEMAERRRIVLIYISHTKKGANNAMDSSSGAKAFVAVSRTAFLIAKDPEREEIRVIASIKSNIGDDKGGAYQYRIEAAEIPDPADPKLSIETGKLVWEGQSSHTVSSLMGPAAGKRASPVTDAAVAFLERMLCGGARPATEIFEAAKKEEFPISKETLKRAKKMLGINSERTPGMVSGPWLWSLPDGGDFGGVSDDG